MAGGAPLQSVSRSVGRSGWSQQPAMLSSVRFSSCRPADFAFTIHVMPPPPPPNPRAQAVLPYCSEKDDERWPWWVSRESFLIKSDVRRSVSFKTSIGVSDPSTEFN